jgi:prevent-host-death family protein
LDGQQGLAVEQIVVDSVQNGMYISFVPLKKISFTDAREELSALIDEVQNSGRPIAITRHGKPVAVLMNMEALEQKLNTVEKRTWMLRGSGTWDGDPAEIDSAIEGIRERFGNSSKKRLEKLVREVSGE